MAFLMQFAIIDMKQSPAALAEILLTIGFVLYVGTVRFEHTQKSYMISLYAAPALAIALRDFEAFFPVCARSFPRI